MKVGNYKVPYGVRTGSLLHFAEPKPFSADDLRELYGVEWRDNTPFPARMRLDSMRSGRSAKYVVWKDVLHREYPMFVADLIDLITATVIGNGVVEGLWVVRKRGQNYGLRFADVQEGS